jgi:glycyl-tRNA synthetase
MPAKTLDDIVSLCKRRGFIFPGSAIYGGLSNSWDYGPLGTALKNALRDWWWERFVQKRQDMVGIDAATIMNPKVWEASGHVANFNDAMVDCKNCKSRHRADHLIENAFPEMNVEGKTPNELTTIIKEKAIACPHCGMKDQFTDVRKFNLLLQTHLGVVEKKEMQQAVYLRGEIAQAMFVNFKNVLTTSRKRLPFGIASVGKAFRNEITPGNFTYRTLEFDLMEFEYFILPEQWEEIFEYWSKEQRSWAEEIGFKKERLRLREHTKDELSHYSKRTVDLEYHTPFGWKEMFGLAYRTDFDLKNHMEKSGEDLQYTDPDDAKIKFIPHVIEPTFGLSRLTLMVMLEAYDEENLEGGDARTVLRFHARIAPVQVAILPLSKKENLIAKAQELYKKIVHETDLRVDFDITGSIGKRYRRQDEIGTPKAVTVDFGTLGEDPAQGAKDTVTIRDRDSLKQERVAIGKLVETLCRREDQST